MLGKVPLKSVALPSEHGGWGFTLEPVLLGLWVSYSAEGWGLAVLALFSFLAHHPLKLLWLDLKRKKYYPRTGLALFIFTLYGICALMGLVYTLNHADYYFLLPLWVALPLILIQLYFELFYQSRHLIPEILGTIGMAAIAPAIALSGGASALVAWSLWLVLALRNIAAIYFARTQVLRARGTQPNVYPSIIVGFASFAVAFGFTVLQIVPLLSSLLMLMLVAYEYWSFLRPPVPAYVVGIGQMLFGLLLVSATVLGRQWHW